MYTKKEQKNNKKHKLQKCNINLIFEELKFDKTISVISFAEFFCNKAIFQNFQY